MRYTNNVKTNNLEHTFTKSAKEGIVGRRTGKAFKQIIVVVKVVLIHNVQSSVVAGKTKVLAKLMIWKRVK